MTGVTGLARNEPGLRINYHYHEGRQVGKDGRVAGDTIDDCRLIVVSSITPRVAAKMRREWAVNTALLANRYTFIDRRVSTHLVRRRIP